MSIPLLNRTARLLAGAFFAMLVASFIVACSDDGPTTPNLEAIAGAYVLETVGGEPVPVAYGSATDSIIDDGFTIDFNGSYSRSGHRLVLAAGRVDTLATIDSGSVTLKGTNITFTSRKDGPQVSGAIVGYVMTLSITPGPFVYQRVRIAY